MPDVLERTFGQHKVIKYLLFQHTIGNLSKNDILSYLERQFQYSSQSATINIIQTFDQFNKHKLSWLFTGLIMTPRVFLFNIQCKIFKKINQHIDLLVMISIFGIQFLLQAGLFLAVADKFTWLGLLGLFVFQMILFSISIFVAGLYCMAREMSDGQW